MQPLAQLEITSELLKSVAEIDEFKGRWEALGNLAPERLSVLRRIATIESVGSSTRIEGVKLTNEEVNHLLSGLDIRSFESRDEQEVGGYADVMELIFESNSQISLSENHIKQLHQDLLRYSEKDQWHRGKYKSLSNNVEAFDEHGKGIGVVFETASVFDAPRLMSELVDWTSSNLYKNEFHPLFVIAVFVVRFLAIHPFQDGNGRLSRALTTLLLLRTGYDYVPFSSLERIVEENKDHYYRALRSAQSTLDGDESQLGEWLTFFMHCLVRQKDVLAAKIERERLMEPLSPLSEKLLSIIRENGRVTVRQGVSVTGENRNTIKAHLKELVHGRKLIQNGKGKGTWYELSS